MADLKALKALKEKLANQKTSKAERKNLRFKPEEGNYQIRLIPILNDPNSPFVELFYHYGLNGKNYLSPRSYGETDPIADFADATILEGGMTKEEYKAVVKLRPALSTNALVIVRGREDEGPLWYSFGKTVYEAIGGYMTELDVDDDGNEIEDQYLYGDISDPLRGHDLRLTYTPAEKSPKKVGNKGIPITELKIVPKKTPLSSDKALVQKWLTEQPSIWDVAGKKFTADELSTVLNRLLNPEAEAEELTTGPAATAWADETPVATVKGNTKKVSAASEEDFDAIFDES
jgi:hypothetical protein